LLKEVASINIQTRVLIGNKVNWSFYASKLSVISIHMPTITIPISAFSNLMDKFMNLSDGSCKIELSSPPLHLLARLHAQVHTGFSSHSPQFCIIRELPTTTLCRPIADPEIHAEWRTIGPTRPTRERRLASTYNGCHY